jgi:hypothetical protein
MRSGACVSVASDCMAEDNIPVIQEGFAIDACAAQIGLGNSVEGVGGLCFQLIVVMALVEVGEALPPVALLLAAPVALPLPRGRFGWLFARRGCRRPRG